MCRWASGSLGADACVGFHCSGGFQKGELGNSQACPRVSQQDHHQGWWHRQVEGCVKVFFEKALSGVSSLKRFFMEKPLFSSSNFRCCHLSSFLLCDMSSLGMDISLKTGKGRETTSEALKFILWHFNSLSGCFCFGLVCFFRWRWEGWVDGKERSHSFRRAFFF